ncbi:hypothetical protein [Microvirga massiliensis]|uniref:hypothetical protein n=1 Tax=Microvirga massiliensis TaxID=1033741 RepID=UPI00062BBE50|nr:hypothetical protein [Microvirga massiliensis]
MSAGTDIPEIERIVFFDGQVLQRRDLAELQRTHRELRWLHNRSLHAWGIGSGLLVAGARGDSVVTVEPGYGIDCLGREIILTTPRVLTVPSNPGVNGDAIYHLIAQWQSDDQQTVVEVRDGSCTAGGAVRLTEEPLLSWQRPGAILEGHGLVLAEIRVRNCQLNALVSLAVRRSARASEQPYVFAGETAAGGTTWDPWRNQADGNMIGVITVVDTSAARFRAVPRYIVEVIGPRFFTSGGRQGLALGITVLHEPRPDRIQVGVQWWPSPSHQVLVDPIAAPGLIGQTLRWRVAWMGIEA